MKTAMSWRPFLLGAALSAIGSVPMHEGPMRVMWAIPAARADDALNTLSSKASGGTTVSASSHASASVTTSASGQGCVAESTAEAKAQAGDEQKSSSDHKRVVGVNGPCQASASSRANAVAGPPVDPSTKE